MSVATPPTTESQRAGSVECDESLSAKELQPKMPVSQECPNCRQVSQRVAAGAALVGPRFEAIDPHQVYCAAMVRGSAARGELIS